VPRGLFENLLKDCCFILRSFGKEKFLNRFDFEIVNVYSRVFFSVALILGFSYSVLSYYLMDSLLFSAPELLEEDFLLMDIGFSNYLVGEGYNNLET